MADHKATRWGLVGAGKIATSFASAIRGYQREEHEIVAVAARDENRAKEFAQKFDITKVYGTYQDLAEDPNVEVAYVSSIHPHHAELTKLMLSHGKHVVCEKPLTMNSGQAREVVQLARDKGLFLMEAFWTRFFPAVEDLRNELTNKTIGEPQIVTVNFGFDIQTVDRLYKKELGGGAVLDLGCYAIMFVNTIFGRERPEKIVASGSLTDSGVDEMINITMHYSKSRMASLNVAMNCEMDNTAFVFGNKGSIKIPNFENPTKLFTPVKTYSHELPENKLASTKQSIRGLMYEVQGVRQSLVKGELESPLMPLDDSLWIMEIMDEVRRQIGVHYDADD